MSYETMFQRYGQPSREADLRVSAYLVRPDAIEKSKDIPHWDASAARMIAECEAMIQNLTEYRKALTARYNELETMSYHTTLLLKRRKNYDGRIEFTASEIKTYSDGTKDVTHLGTRPGKERAQILKDFDALCKSRPDCEAIKDIEKGRWER